MNYFEFLCLCSWLETISSGSFNSLGCLTCCEWFVILSITFNKLHIPDSPNISLFQLNINFFIGFKQLLLTNEERGRVKSEVK
jgi:hypothetical protein